MLRGDGGLSLKGSFAYLNKKRCVRADNSHWRWVRFYIANKGTEFEVLINKSMHL